LASVSHEAEAFCRPGEPYVVTAPNKLPLDVQALGLLRFNLQRTIRPQAAER
jgi:hypothetical protein